MESSDIPFQRDRSSNVLDSNLVLAYLVSNHAEKMNRIGMIRFCPQNQPVDLFGSLQPAALMVLDRQLPMLRKSLPCRILWQHGLPAAMRFKRKGEILSQPFNQWRIFDGWQHVCGIERPQPEPLHKQ